MPELSCIYLHFYTLYAEVFLSLLASKSMQLKFHIDADSLTADERSCSMAKCMKSVQLSHTTHIHTYIHINA